MSKVTRSSTSTKPDLEFRYDPMGNRRMKIVKPRTGNGLQNEQHWQITHYTRDASGNMLATYTQKHESNHGTGKWYMKLNLDEYSLYGSRRLGAQHQNQMLTSSEISISSYDSEGYLSYQTVQGATTTEATEAEMGFYQRPVTAKAYELSNHLGNVLQTISDRKIAVPSGSSVGYYAADVLSYNDYYPFGMVMEDRNGSNHDHRFGFQDQETDGEIWGGSSFFKYRMNDPRIGRFFVLDPLAVMYPHNSTYAFSENRLLDGVEFEGLEHYDVHLLHHSEAGTAAHIRLIDKNNNKLKVVYIHRNGSKNELPYFIHTEMGSIYQGARVDAYGRLVHADGTLFPHGNGAFSAGSPTLSSSQSVREYTASYKGPSTVKKLKAVAVEPMGISLDKIVESDLSIPPAIPEPKPKLKPPQDPDPQPELDIDPVPQTSSLTLNVPFVKNRAKFNGNPNTTLTPILNALRENPKNFVTLSPNTKYSQGEDIPDLWGLIGDGETSDDLVRLRGKLIKKWFTDRGIKGSQIKIDTSDSYNKEINVTGQMTKFEAQ